MNRLQAFAAIAALTAASASAQQAPLPLFDASPRVLAMMDDMEKEMGSMKKMDPMPKKEMSKPAGSGPAMQGGMPMPGTGAQSPDGAAAKGDAMGGGSGMDMMGRMREPMEKRGMSNMPASSSLPGFPGASHLYHVGSTGFFLDHPQHITLTTAQQAALNRTREQSALEQATFERRIEQAEQELWTLTAAEAPELAKIEAKARAIEKLRADQRVAFIKSVGEAGKVLTADQRKAVLGSQAPAAKGGSAAAPATSAAPAAAQPAPMKMH